MMLYLDSLKTERNIINLTLSYKKTNTIQCTELLFSSNSKALFIKLVGGGEKIDCTIGQSYTEASL